MLPEVQPGFSRRQFLWLVLAGTGSAAVARLSLRRLRVSTPAPAGLTVLDARGWTVLRAASEVMLPPDAAADPDVLDAVVRCADRYLRAAPTVVQRQVRALLGAVEFGPLLFARSSAPCSALSLAARRRYLAQWETSRLAFRRVGFRAVKQLVMLGFYTRDAAWERIGYTGPWV